MNVSSDKLAVLESQNVTIKLTPEGQFNTTYVPSSSSPLRWSIAVVLSMALLVVFSVHVLLQKRSQSKIPEHVLNYINEHPFNASISPLTPEEEERQIAKIEIEYQRMMELLNQNDDDIVLRGHQLTDTDMQDIQYGDQDEYWHNRRNLQSFHEPAACDLPMEPCSEITITDRYLGVIPCQVCKVISSDMGTIDFPNGLLVQGKLHILSTANGVIKSTHIFVEGELKIDLPNEGNEVIFRMYGTKNQVYTASPVCPDGCNMGSKAIAVVGGKMDITGYPNNCPSFEKLVGVFEFNGEIRTLLVSQAARACWVPGTELLLTSHTRTDDGKQFVKVESYDPVSGLLTIDQAIQRPITILDNPDYAIEVASLTRRVKFEVDEAEASSIIGGHFIVHNTASAQHLEGIEIRHFGQQGILGRYPLHFHKCGDSFNSVVAKNVVRDSNQRGYVIHVTNQVVLSGNVGVDVIGHLYFLEDGVEEYNNFIGNLGAGVKSMPAASVALLSQQNAPKREATDDTASVFWISNPRNFFISNVAAGSAIHGYWFETEVLDFPDFYDSPAFMDLFAFIFNEVHSCAATAFTVYPPGWRPDGVNGHNLIQGLKVYRNNGWGAFLHVTQSLKFLDCHFADNGALDVFINRGDSLVFENCKFLAQTDFAETYPACYLGKTGIRLHPSLVNEPVFNVEDRAPYGKYKGSSLINTSFEKYSRTGASCAAGNEEDFLPLEFTVSQVFQNTFDSPHSFRGVTFDNESSNNPVDSCDLYMEHGIENVNMEIEEDLAMTFSSSGEPGFLVSPKWSAMLPGNNCEMYKDCGQYPGTSYNPGGLDYCPGVCLRTILIQTDPLTTYGAKLVVFDLDNITLTHVDGHLRLGATNFDRLYTAVLPEGNYLFFFQNESGQNVEKSDIESRYPLQVKLGAAPACSNYFTEDSYVI